MSDIIATQMFVKTKVFTSFGFSSIQYNSFKTYIFIKVFFLLHFKNSYIITIYLKVKYVCLILFIKVYS